MIITGDCRETLKTLHAESVQTCVTSPPYYGLRDYGHAAQIGLEETPDQYVAQLVEVFREVRRVLRDDGTLWLNLGDSYAGNGTAYDDSSSTLRGSKQSARMGEKRQKKHGAGLKPKDLIGIPWRVAFALQADGWWLRMDNIWSKSNPMPESVTDRCTKAHEYVFLLSKSASYFYDAKAIQEPAVSDAPAGNGFAGRQGGAGGRPMSGGGGTPDAWQPVESRNRRSVWNICTKPYAGAHFATMPPELAALCIQAASPKVVTELVLRLHRALSELDLRRQMHLDAINRVVEVVPGADPCEAFSELLERLIARRQPVTLDGSDLDVEALAVDMAGRIAVTLNEHLRGMEERLTPRPTCERCEKRPAMVGERRCGECS